MADKLFKIPNSLIYQGDSKNWKKFKQQFDIYMKASGLEKNDSENKVNIFLNIAGEEALEIFNSLNLSPEERLDYDSVIQAFEAHCVSKHNEIYKSFKFFTRVQQPSEFFSEFYDDLLVMASFCNFGNQKNRLIRDRIIAGIKSPKLQEQFLKSPDLSLEEVVNICLDNEVEKMNSGHLKYEHESNLEELTVDGESNNNYDELSNLDTNVENLNTLDMIHIPNEILLNDSEEGFDEDMDLIDLHSEIDVPDVKPITPSMLNIIHKSSKQQNLPVQCEESEPNEELDKTLEEPNNIEETESSLEYTNKKDIQTKIKEVKRKLTNAIKLEAGGKRQRTKRKVTLSRIKTELEEEQGYDSDDNFLNSYIPVEDQDEYSQIENEDSFIPVEDQDEYSQIDGENSCIPVEDQDEYSQIEGENSCIPAGDQDEYSQTEREESDIFPSAEEENELETVIEGNAALIDYEKDIEDQEEYSQISYQESEISELSMECSEGIHAENGGECSEIEDAEASTAPVDENIEYEYIHEDSEKSFREEEECDDEEMEVENCREDSEYEAPIEVINEMAEAEYLLEKDTNVSPKTRGRKKRKNAKSTKDLGPKTPKIIKINRDNLPPLIVKSIRKKTLLLGKMPFACKKCDATFWTSFQLDKHQLVHVLKKAPAPVKPPSKVFKCEECGKEFKKICDLERHTRVHTGEKPSVCNICNKRFQQSYNLNKHLYTHTQEKNFECVICQKKFGRNDVLNRHVLTHSIVKPFRCSVCSRTFIRNTQLKLHLQKHHGLDEDPENESSNADNVAGTSAD